MAQQEEIVLWIDRRWRVAIEKQLKGETLQEHLDNVLDELCNRLPDQEYAEATVRKPAAPETPERTAPTENTSTAFLEPENPGAPPAPENADTSAGVSRSDSTDLPPSEGERPVYTPPQSDVQSRATGSTYDPPTVGEAVVRMLHHMSRIFEDNSRTDRIHRGLQIDRKRRQELQRKRLAMGHKADDHEEISFK